MLNVKCGRLTLKIINYTQLSQSTSWIGRHVEGDGLHVEGSWTSCRGRWRFFRVPDDDLLGYDDDNYNNNNIK